MKKTFQLIPNFDLDLELEIDLPRIRCNPNDVKNGRASPAAAGSALPLLKFLLQNHEENKNASDFSEALLNLNF